MKKNKKWFWLFVDRALSYSVWVQIGLVLAFLLLLYITSRGAVALCCQNPPDKFLNGCGSSCAKHWLLPFYLLVDSNALNNIYFSDNPDINGWLLLISTITFLFGMLIFNGVVIGVIANWIVQRVQNYKEGHCHYLKSGHYVVMGWDDMVPCIIRNIMEKEKNGYVLLLTSLDSQSIRDKLRRTMSEKQIEHIIINNGHRTAKEYYGDLHLELAEEIYIVGNRSLPTHDAINVECVEAICGYLKEKGLEPRPKRITCVFEDIDTYAAFKTAEIFEAVRDLDIEFVPYNFYTAWAKRVFVDNLNLPQNEPSLIYREGIGANDTHYVHLVFVGISTFATTFAMEAAQFLHFPNRRNTRITFIDLNADKEMPQFIIRNRHFFEVQSYYYRDLTISQAWEKEERRHYSSHLTNSQRDFLDVDFEFIKGDVFSERVQKLLCQWATDKGQYLSVFLTMANQRENFSMGMNMPDEIYDCDVPLFIRQDRSDVFVTNLRLAHEREKYDYSVCQDGNVVTKERRSGRYAKLYPFGMNGVAFDLDERILTQAKIINYLYERVDCNNDVYEFPTQKQLESMSAKSILEDAEKRWSKLPVAYKWSNLYSAYQISCKLASMKKMEDMGEEKMVECMAEVEHNRWNVEKLLLGYRKARLEEDKYNEEINEGMIGYKKLKDNKKLFIHGDIRPYNKLNQIKNLDRGFVRYIPWILKVCSESTFK